MQTRRFSNEYSRVDAMLVDGLNSLPTESIDCFDSVVLEIGVSLASATTTSVLKTVCAHLKAPALAVRAVQT